MTLLSSVYLFFGVFVLLFRKFSIVPELDPFDLQWRQAYKPSVEMLT
jgi:hypothetical protein